MVVAVLLALIVEHGPELDSSNGLDEPHDGRASVVELEHQRVGLQVGLARHTTRREALLLHPGDDGTYALYGHIVVVATVLDVVTLRAIGHPAVHKVNLLQLSEERLALFGLSIHVGRLYQVVE